MGKSNIAVKQWLRDKQRFADLFNGTVFQGEQIVLPEDLEEIDSESSIIVTDKESKEKGIEKYRDIVMRWKENAELTLLACENQKKMHYAMPVRMMVYDGLSYADQIRQIWKNHESDKKVTEEEFLSKFRKEDKIYPVISLVFYYGLNPWDASTDLYGMFQRESEIRNSDIWKKYLPNYRINLIDAGNVQSVEKFRSDLQLIFGMLKYRGKGSGMQEYLEKHRKYFSSVDRETYQAVRELLHSESQLKSIVSEKNGKESVNMCKALEDIYNDGLNEGKKELIAQLIQNNFSKGYSPEMIADMLEVELEIVQKILDK